MEEHITDTRRHSEKGERHSTECWKHIKGSVAASEKKHQFLLCPCPFSGVPVSRKSDGRSEFVEIGTPNVAYLQCWNRLEHRKYVVGGVIHKVMVEL